MRSGTAISLMQALAPLTLAPLTAKQLTLRPVALLRTAGEVFRHIALGRINWFLRMDAPGSCELAEKIQDWHQDSHGNRYVIEEALPITDDAGQLSHPRRYQQPRPALNRRPTCQNPAQAGYGSVLWSRATVACYGRVLQHGSFQ